MNMTTPPPDLDNQPLELLIKLMRMTEAEDNIALVAIKKANSHLKKMGTDWEAVLRSKVKIIADPFASINIPQAAMNPNRNQDYTPTPPRRPAPPPPPQPTATPYQAPQRPTRPSPVRPRPGAQPFAGDVAERKIVNQYQGTCTTCKNIVQPGDGMATQWRRPDGSKYWTTTHSGACPATRKHKPATTADDFQL